MRSLDLLTIKGMDVSGLECFEALFEDPSSEPGSGDISLTIPQPLAITSARPAFPLDIWNQQSDALAQQSAKLFQMQTMLRAKLEELPQETNSPGFISDIVSSLLEEGGVKAFYTGLKLFGMWLAGTANVVYVVMAFLISLAFFYLKDVWNHYTQGIEACGQMLLENQALESLQAYGEDGLDSEKAWEYFQLRETVIVRHQRDIHNLLMEIIALEERTVEAMGSPTSNMSELVQAVKDLQFNGLEFVYKDGSKYVLEGQTPVGTD